MMETKCKKCGQNMWKTNFKLTHVDIEVTEKGASKTLGQLSVEYTCQNCGYVEKVQQGKEEE